MVSKSHAKRRQDIKTKLMAAIAMLLVSSIMMVSSTYAWFTLSTAPEVTGINTSVGANGNLEMALMPKDGELASIESEVGDSQKDLVGKNITWGNLVELSNADNADPYGLKNIVLYPAQLNYLSGSTTQIDQTNYLLTPAYGSDGRISVLEAGGLTGVVDTDGKFYPDSNFGVRAVGNASGMTQRQLDYRNAIGAVNGAAAQAKNVAAQSLNTNGSALASIAIKHGTANNGSDSYVSTDLATMRTIITDLRVVLGHLDNAYKNAILAVAASGANTNENAWNVISTEVAKNGSTLASVEALLGQNGIDISSVADLGDAINHYKAMVTEVDTADTALEALETQVKDSYTWSEISSVLSALADPNAMMINGIKAGEINQGDNMQTLVNDVAGGGIKVTMATGGGVYADVADQCGDFSANIVIESVSYGGLSLSNLKASMQTKTSVTPVWLSATASALNILPAVPTTTTERMPITDMFGYIIDLAFRTNAAESDLLLQTEAKDRIYDENDNEETLGHGSSMTFKADTGDLTDENIKQLMSAIRIVFFDPANGNILGNAKLDTANATFGADGWTAKMYLYGTVAGATTYELATDVTAENFAQGTYYTQDATDLTKYNPADTYVDGTDYYIAVQGAATESNLEGADAVIAALNQNQATAISVLVYLDGASVTNSMVAATGTTSMTGSMNLQFASSATLVPMEYADLHQQKGNNEGQGN